MSVWHSVMLFEDTTPAATACQLCFPDGKILLDGKRAPRCFHSLVSLVGVLVIYSCVVLSRVFAAFQNGLNKMTELPVCVAGVVDMCKALYYSQQCPSALSSSRLTQSPFFSINRAKQ